MADDKDKKDIKKDEKDAKPEAAAAPKKSKLPLIIGGAILGNLVFAFLAATMAVPKKAEPAPELDGPFVAKLSKNELQVNLAGEGSKRYLVMTLNAEYFAYDEAFVQARTGSGGGEAGGHGGGEAHEDPQYSAMLMDRLLAVASTKTREEVTDAVMIDAFLEEMRREVEPVLFPVVVGHVHMANEADPESGLKPGESMHLATMRGLMHEHHLIVDGPKLSVQLDHGPTVRFTGSERDLCVSNEQGQCVYLDVTGIKREFEGEVAVGVPGKLRRVLREKFLVQ